MNVARLNFSHGSQEQHQRSVENVREACRITGINCAILLDTKGPEIRTGLLKGSSLSLSAGQEIDVLTHVPDDFQGDENGIRIDWRNLAKHVRVGGLIKIADGLILLKVTQIFPEEGRVRCRALNAAVLGDRKNVNVPGAQVDLPDVTEKDKLDFGFALRLGLDFIAASFTRSGAAVREMRRVLAEYNNTSIKIICKIENQQGLDNFDDILNECDGIMVARGDLGVEIPIQKVVTAQKMMIRKCNAAGAVCVFFS